MTTTSPFLNPGPVATADSLAILHLKRDHLVPVKLRATTSEDNGYAEGAVVNTRFGSFPHSTLVNVPWGTQIAASKVDTGSRGRKRKLDEARDESADSGPKTAITASTGFVHLLPPAPESWTISLPHRTQVVYTPDSSYILQRLGVVPGSRIIEAGAGSGSFTHASARAVFNGHRPGSADVANNQATRPHGQVCSFEYHEPRVTGLQQEISEHGLSDIVQVTHRDVYEEGFLLNRAEASSPNANAIFLDLPSPWLALRHLVRQRLPQKLYTRVTDPLATESNPNRSSNGQSTPIVDTIADPQQPFVSPLDPTSPVHICTFSPCIEQVQATVAAMRMLGWTEIEMVEVAQRRIDVRRERVGLQEEGLRGVNATAANVDEAVARLRQVEGRFKDWQENGGKENGDDAKAKESKQARLERIARDAKGRKLFKEGRLIHRTESDAKTHTSYLVFAVLPQEWTEENEQRCLSYWGTGPAIKEETEGKSGGSRKAKRNK